MFPFTRLGHIDRTERKALLFAFLFCAIFIVLLRVSAPAKRVRKLPMTVVSTTPLTKPAESFVDPLERFRVKSENFYGVDFWNFSYGIYMPSVGKPINLTLINGKLVENDAGWFTLNDVYYKDLTNDGLAEAIVRLSHGRCSAGFCDGGRDLFYIYTTRTGKLESIWRFETGTYANGCGLKSFTLGRKQIVLEQFGRCSRKTSDYPGEARFMAEDFTFMLFEFDGVRFQTKSIQYIPAPSRELKNYEPEIRIF